MLASQCRKVVRFYGSLPDHSRSVMLASQCREIVGGSGSPPDHSGTEVRPEVRSPRSELPRSGPELPRSRVRAEVESELGSESSPDRSRVESSRGTEVPRSVLQGNGLGPELLSYRGPLSGT